MLAGAGVVERARRLAGAHQRIGGSQVGRHLDAAFEIGRGASAFFEHPSSNGDVTALTAVRGAGHRQFLFAVAESLGGAAFDQRQSLNQLDRRTREDCGLDVADRSAAVSMRIDDRDRAAVAAFH